jgi:TetR/AcrR family fatty acid metabolism transcriptional regulator
MSSELVGKKNTTDKRVKIINAAIVVFSNRGFYNSTVADVAREANVADGTIYLYFKNKEDLLISIFEHSMDFFIQAGLVEIEKIESPLEKLKSFVSLHLKLVQKNQDLAQVIQIELRQSSKFMKEYRNEKFFEYLGIVQSILEDGQKQGCFREEINPHILKRAIFGAVDEMALEWVLMKKKKYSMQEASTQLCDLITQGIVQ